MNKLAIIAILAIILLACTPMMPSRKQTENKTIQNITVEKIEQNQTTEPPETKGGETPATETTEPTPDLKDVPIKELIEGELVSFPNLKAVDPDGDPITYTFTEPLNEKGKWQTKEGDAGDKLVTITASDGTNTVSQQVLLRIKPKNKPPVISLAEPVEAKEGETFTIQPNATDPEGKPVTLTYSGWMTSETKEVTYGEAGLHKVIITATDGTATITKEVIVSVQKANRAPELAEISTIKIKEGQKATISANAKDPDNDKLVITYDFPFDDAGVWQTEIGDAGEYDVAVKASDGSLTAERTAKIIIEAVNKAPVIDMQAAISVKEGETVTLNPTITDPEGDEIRVTYSGWMTSTVKSTGYDDQGNHKVTIAARDTAGNEAKLEVIITVEDMNRPPIFGAGSFT